MLDETTCFVAGGKALAPPSGLDLRNFRDPAVHRFTGRDRTGRSVTEVVVHESVTRSAAQTIAVLRRRGLGVHLVVAQDGRVTQHGDLSNDRLAHASGHNGPSVGIEIVTPYYGDQLRTGLPWSQVIDARWALERHPHDAARGRGPGHRGQCLRKEASCRIHRMPSRAA